MENEKEIGRHGGGMRSTGEIKEKKEVKKAWDKIRDENSQKMYKEKKSKAKKEVAMTKGRACEDLYAGLETKESEKELHRLDIGRGTERGKMYST